MRRLRTVGIAISIAVPGLGVAPAAAQNTVVYTPDFDPDRFVLTSDPDAIGLTEGARPLGRGEYAAGLALRLGGPPLSVCVEDHATGECSVEGDLVNARFGADLVGAYGFGRVSAHVQLPVVLYQSSDFDPAMGEPGLSAANIGDLRLGGKLGITRFGDAALGWDLTFSLPTGGGDSFVGDAGTVIENRALLDWRRGRLAAGASLGYAFRSSAGSVGDLYVDDELLWSAAAQYQVTPEKLDVGLALFGRVGVMTDPDPMMATADLGWEERPAELLASTVYRLSETLSLEGGAGMGLDSGYGAPPFRVLAAMRWTERKKPEPPPPPPPPTPEPPGDTDGDGILDPDDQCVTEAEDQDGFEDENGCPDLDDDQDGIPDATDQCKLDPEDQDGFEDENGCPDPDNDQDGILDTADGCPMEAEDLDGFEDENGCPEADNDKDGIVDADDRCPLEPEVFNGVDDADGCPDTGGPTATVTGDQVEILERIEFDTNRAKIRRKSYKILDAVVGALNAHATLRVRIEGHTDDKAAEGFNQTLSERRAEAVKAYLVKKGVAADRLETAGFGESRPRAEGTSAAARATNRRVEFVIIQEPAP
ncbi:MAG: OmpA family protein [Deltaproteobacteria bacterium]|nr:OmpA family protein [Kofleriaceae bacterium]